MVYKKEGLPGSNDPPAKRGANSSKNNEIIMSTLPPPKVSAREESVETARRLKAKISTVPKVPESVLKKRIGIDWLSIETDYVQGFVIRDPKTNVPRHTFPTLRDLAKTYGINYGHLTQKSSKGKWTAKKDAFRAQIQATRSAQNLSGLLSESVKFDSAHLAQIEMLHGMMDFYLNPYKRILEKNDKGEYTYYQDIDLDDPDDVEFYNKYKPTIKDMSTLMTMIRDSHTIVRNILGEPINAATVMNSAQSAVKEVDKVVRNVKDMSKEDREQRLKELAAKQKLSEH